MRAVGLRCPPMISSQDTSSVSKRVNSCAPPRPQAQAQAPSFHACHGFVSFRIWTSGRSAVHEANTFRRNVLFLPFRRTNSLSVSDAIRQYISSKYDQHPDMFKQDLEVVDALRRDAVNIREPHPSGIKKISAYAGQLSWMGGKFPIDVCYPASSSKCLRD